MTVRKYIGFSGKAGAGKDTACTYLQQHLPYKHSFLRYSFAKPLKKAAAEAFGINLDYFTEQELKDTIHEPWGVSARQIAQFLGTEMFRETVSKLCPHVEDNFWILRLEKELTNSFFATLDGFVVITDVRFQNEIDWLCGKKNGLLINIVRPGADGNVGISGHASEAGFDVAKWKGQTYEVINDGSPKELGVEVMNIIRTFYPY